MHRCPFIGGVKNGLPNRQTGQQKLQHPQSFLHVYPTHNSFSLQIYCIYCLEQPLDRPRQVKVDGWLKIDTSFKRYVEMGISAWEGGEEELPGGVELHIYTVVDPSIAVSEVSRFGVDFERQEADMIEKDMDFILWVRVFI